MDDLKGYGLSSLERLLEVETGKHAELAVAIAESEARIAALEAEIATRAPPAPNELTAAIEQARGEALKEG